MKHAFNCPLNPMLAGEFTDALVFVWDDEAGTVSGPGAGIVRELIRGGEVDAGPHPRCTWPLDDGSLTRRADMAALIGHAWIVPDQLADDYPEMADSKIPATTYTNTGGVVVIGHDQLRF